MSQAVKKIETAPKPQNIQLKKGSLLFSEGDTSRSMYYVKKGVLRIFKKKGEAQIEIDTIRAGQILGELAFLDGQPRSASVEALTDCEMVEISSETFQETLTKIPEWLKLLLKTVVGRLRSASTRIRQLEQSSTSFEYSTKTGTKNANYVFINWIDALKVMASVLLVATRNGKNEGKGFSIPVGLLQRYANQISGIPIAKITTVLDLLGQVDVVSLGDETGGQISVLDLDFLEKSIAFINEQNILEQSKRQELTLRGFLILNLMNKHISEAVIDTKTGMGTLNIAAIKMAHTAGDKEPFRLDEFEELVSKGFATQLNLKSGSEAFTQVNMEKFSFAYRCQKLLKAIEAANDQKAKQK